MIELEVLPPDAPFRGGNFLQSAFWAAFKASFGWRALAFRFRLPAGEGRPALEGELRVLLRRLAGPLSFAYVPGGPVLDCPPSERSRLLGSLASALRSHLPPLCVFLRFDPPWWEAEPRAGREGEEGGEEVAPGTPRKESDGKGRVSRPLLDPPLRKAGADVQPPDSVLLDLGPEEAELLAAMKPKWRYNVRLAEKKGVEVEEGGFEGLDAFYRLYEETARRDRIAIHPRSYYEKLFQVCAGATEAPRLGLWTARHEGRAIAAIITLFRGEEAVYLYGASADEKRALMPAYALQWAAIRGARAAGCKRYDFYGIPPIDDPTHPMSGLYRFKTGFGGTVVHYAGSWDLPLHPLAYAAWRGAEGARAWWYKVAKKKLSARSEAQASSPKTSPSKT